MLEKKEAGVDSKKIFFFVLVVVIGAMFWAFDDKNQTAPTVAPNAALPVNGMVGKTVSDAAKEAVSTVPVIPGNAQ
jgi:hypothetical protein